MSYFEGCKKGILFHWKSKGIACYGLQVRYWECFASVFIPVFGWICKCKYDTSSLWVCLFFSPHCFFFNIYCAFLCYLEGFLLLFYCCKCGNLGLYLPESPCLLRMKGKYSWSFFLFVVAHILSFVNQFVHFEEDPFL